MKKSEAQMAASEATDLGDLQIIKHSAGATWIAKDLATGSYLTVTFEVNEDNEVCIEGTGTTEYGQHSFITAAGDVFTQTR